MHLLSEGSDSEDDLSLLDFGSKSHFDSREWHELLNLQTRYKNDKRFTLNERFQEKEGGPEKNRNIVSPLEDKKQTQLHILESVLGRKATTKPKAAHIDKPKMKLRFDPDHRQHKAFELSHQEQNPFMKKKKRKDTEKIQTQETAPDVSKNKFYKVAEMHFRQQADRSLYCQQENRLILATTLMFEKRIMLKEQPKAISIATERFFSRTSDEKPMETQKNRENTMQHSSKHKQSTDCIRF